MLLIPVKSCVCNRLLNNRVLTLEVGVESVFWEQGAGEGGGAREEGPPPLRNGQGILFSISAIWLINSTPRAIDYFNSWWCVIEQLHAMRHPLDYILVMRACPHLFQRSTLRKLPNSSYRDQIFMHRRSIDLRLHMFARIARGVTGNRQHSQIKSNQMFLLAYMIYIILHKIYIL